MLIRKDPETYYAAHLVKEAKLADLRRKLQKLVSKRNISFNLPTVFNIWKKWTIKTSNNEKVTLQAMEELRQHIKKVEGKNKGKMRTADTQDNDDTEGKTTENDMENDKQQQKMGSLDGKKRQLYQDEDNDNDIKECDAYIKQTNLIPNCFGVYKPE